MVTKLEQHKNCPPSLESVCVWEEDRVWKRIYEFLEGEDLIMLGRVTDRFYRLRVALRGYLVDKLDEAMRVRFNKPPGWPVSQN